MPGFPESRPAPPATLAFSAPGFAGSRARTAAVLSAFVLVYFTLEMTSAIQRSATFDEPVHLTAGYLALSQRNYLLDFTHPPFLRMWAALPLLGRHGPELQPERFADWNDADWVSNSYGFSREFLYAGPDSDAWLNAARAMVMVLGAVLGILVFCWIREWLGFAPAVLGLLFYLLEPNLSAHAALVTTDLGVTCFYFGTIYFLWRTWRGCTLLNLAGLALFFSLAAVSKFTAVLLGPAVGLLLALAVGGGMMSWRRAAGILALLGATAFCAVWAVYGFRYAPGVGADWLLHTGNMPLVQRQLPVVSAVLNWVDAHHLLPNAYTQGFLLGYVLADPIPGFLAGEISATGWWYYFPVAFLLKTPLALLVLLGGGLFTLVRARARLGLRDIACVLLPAVVYLAFAMTSGINLGLRHILPVYPFVLLVAAVAAWGVLGATWPVRAKWLVLGPVLVFWLVTFLQVYPRSLTYFNRLVGGSRNGAHYLVDSNLDWGQHLKLLKGWMDRHGVKRINLAYFGSADPDYYGIDDIPLPGAPVFNRGKIARPRLPGYVAVSVTLLSGVYLSPEWRLFYRGLAEARPVAVIGNTINVYWLERWPEAPPDLTTPAEEESERHRLLARALARLGWDDYAVGHYRKYLRDHPENCRALIRLGQALVRLQRADEALPHFRRAVELDPQQGDGRGALATLLLERRDTAGALRHARAYARLQPKNPYAHDLLGVALAVENRQGDAVAAFTRALELAPGEAVIRQHLAMARQMQAAGGTQARP